MWSGFAEICTSYYSRRVRHCLKIQIFTEKGCSESLHFFFSFCPTLRPFFSVKEAKIEKTKYSWGQNYTIRLSKNRKVKALSCPNFSWKIRLRFILFWPVFVEKKGVVTTLGIKIWPTLLQSHNSGACSSQKSLVPELPSLAAIGAKGLFFFNFRPLFQVWLLF